MYCLARSTEGNPTASLLSVTVQHMVRSFSKGSPRVYLAAQRRPEATARKGSRAAYPRSLGDPDSQGEQQQRKDSESWNLTMGSHSPELHCLNSKYVGSCSCPWASIIQYRHKDHYNNRLTVLEYLFLSTNNLTRRAVPERVESEAGTDRKRTSHRPSPRRDQAAVCLARVMAGSRARGRRRGRGPYLLQDPSPAPRARRRQPAAPGNRSPSTPPESTPTVGGGGVTTARKLPCANGLPKHAFHDSQSRGPRKRPSPRQRIEGRGQRGRARQGHGSTAGGLRSPTRAVPPPPFCGSQTGRGHDPPSTPRWGRHVLRWGPPRRPCPLTSKSPHRA